jgi:hypothetical protein
MQRLTRDRPFWTEWHQLGPGTNQPTRYGKIPAGTSRHHQVCHLLEIAAWGRRRLMPGAENHHDPAYHTTRGGGPA